MNMDSNVNLTSRYDERFSNLRLSPHNYEKTSYSFNEDITRTDNNFTRMKEDKIYRQYKNNMPNKAVGNKEKLLTNVEQEVNQIERLIPVK